MTTKTTPPPFPTLTIHSSDGDIVVPCEPIGDWFAITPEFAMTANFDGLLRGTFLVSLYPSGARLSQGSGCIHCARRAALAWSKLPLDWASLTSENSTEWAQAQQAEALREFLTNRDLGFDCDTSYCEIADGDDRSEPMGDTIAIPAGMLDAAVKS